MTMNLRRPVREGTALTLAGLLAACAAQMPPPITRTAIGDPHFPIAAAVAVPNGYDTVYISGALPDVADPAAPKGTVEAYGDTRTQTLSVLKKLGESLKAQGLGFGDVVAAHVYLVGDPHRNGEIDFSGMNAAFSQFFGSAGQPNKPARAAVKVAGLVVPGTLVEIELIAARAPGGR